MEIEDKPIQAKGCYTDFDGDQVGEQEVEEKGPLSLRIESKNWKTRAKAYQELNEELIQSGTYDVYLTKLLKFLNDSNPNPQEKSLEILKNYLQNQAKLLLGLLGGIVKVLVEKNISGSRPSSKELAKDLLPLLYQVDKSQVLLELIKYFDHKNPKFVTASLSGVTLILMKLSYKSLDLNMISVNIAKAAEHTNQLIRSEAMNWFKELYKQIREGISPFLMNLKKQQQEELRRLFDTMEIDEVEKVDAYELVNAKDIFGKFNEKWAENVVDLEKWTEKKEALEEINQAADYPKLVEKSPQALVGMIKRLMGDNNVHVVSLAIRLLGLLARGQKRYFEGFAKLMAPVLLTKFRDKNKAIISETHRTLELFLESIAFEQMLTYIETALSDKTVNTKLNILTWISKIIQIGKLSNENIKELFIIVKLTLEDSNESVRDSSCLILRTLLQSFPDLISFLSDLPDAKKKKITSAPVKVNQVPKHEVKMDVDEVKPLIAVKKVVEVKEFNSIPLEIMEKLQEKNWKVRELGLNDLKALAAEFSSTDRLIEIHELVFKTMNNFKENNLNLVREAFECLNILYLKCEIPEDLLSKVLSQPCIEKIAENKVSDIVKQTLLNVSELIGPNEILVKFLAYSKDSPKPKTLVECSELISQLIKDYNIKLFDFKPLLEYSKFCISHTNPVIKKSGVTVFKSFYSKIGCSIYEGIEDLKEPIQKMLKDEFLKVQPDCSESRKLRTSIKCAFSSDINKRLNISAQISPQLMNELGSKDWKEKKSGLEKLMNIIPKKLAPVGIADLMRTLKSLLLDSNKIVVKTSLEVLNKVADALDEECSGYWRPIVAVILSLLKDKTATLRSAAKLSIEKWASKIGPEKILNIIGEALKSDSLESRTEILSWILSNKSFLSKCEIKSLIPSIILCLQDRTITVRNQSEVVFGEIIEIVGFDPVKPFLSDMKPAVLKALEPIFEKYKGPLRVNCNSKTVGSKYSPKFFFIIPQKKNKIEIQSWEKIPSNQLESLKSEVKCCSSQDLSDLLFTADSVQKQNVPNLLEGMIENPYFSETFDIIFKWTLLEFCQNNPQSIKVAVDCINLALRYSKQKDIKPSEAEFELIIPVLTIKSLEASTASLCKSTLMTCFEIYNEEKAYNSLIVGLQAKNTVKMESLMLFKEVFSTFRGQVTVKVFKFLENFAKAKESKIKDEALEILLCICKNQGSSMLDYIDRGFASLLLPQIKKENIPEKIAAKGMMPEIIEKLNSPEFKKKIEGLLFLQKNLLSQFKDFEKYPAGLREEFIDSLLNFSHSLFGSRIFGEHSKAVYETLPIEEVKAILTIILNVFAATNILKTLPYGYIKSVYNEFILRTSTKEISIVLRDPFSDLLLTLLDNTEDTTMFKVLFEILQAEISLEYTQITSKCILRNIKFLHLFNLDHKKCFLYMHECLNHIASNFFDENEPRIKLIKLFLLEFVFIHGEKIYELYDEVIKLSDLKDEHIEDWIEVIFSGNFLAFQIFERLKKGESFEKGVEELKDLISAGRQINLNFFVNRYLELGERVGDAMQKWKSGEVATRFPMMVSNSQGRENFESGYKR